MPSTGNIFDVAPQQEQPTKAVNHADGTGVVANRKPSIDTNSDTQLISENSNTYGGVAVSPAAPKVLDVADHEGMVGDERVSGTTNGPAPVCALMRGSEYQASPADSQFKTISQKQRIDAEMRLIFRSSTFTTLDPADDPRFA